MYDSGLVDNTGWIPNDASTLQCKANGYRHREVYVIGDSGSADIPKTGIAAHYQSLITAQNIINDIQSTGESLFTEVRQGVHSVTQPTLLMRVGGHTSPYGHTTGHLRNFLQLNLVDSFTGCTIIFTGILRLKPWLRIKL